MAEEEEEEEVIEVGSIVKTGKEVSHSRTNQVVVKVAQEYVGFSTPQLVVTIKIVHFPMLKPHQKLT